MSEAGQLGYGGGGENWGRAHVPLGTIATWLLLIERFSNALVHGGAVHYFQHLSNAYPVKPEEHFENQFFLGVLILILNLF